MMDLLGNRYGLPGLLLSCVFSGSLRYVYDHLIQSNCTSNLHEENKLVILSIARQFNLRLALYA